MLFYIACNCRIYNNFKEIDFYSSQYLLDNNARINIREYRYHLILYVYTSVMKKYL